MSLTERYIYAVTRHLPLNQRDEVAKELGASIDDMATDRAKNGTPKESDIKTVLVELGDPAVLASKYSNTTRYLIGPKWFDAYWGVLKQLLYIVPVIVISLMALVNYAITGKSWIESIIHAVGSGIAVAIQIAFWTTLTFFGLEHWGELSPKDITGKKSKNEAWTPDDLPFPPKARQIPAVESWISVGLIIAATGWVVFSPLWGNNWLNPALWGFWIPAFVVLSVASAVHYIFRAVIGNWTTPLVVSNIMLGVASVAFIVALVSTQTVINPEFIDTLSTKEGVNIGQASTWVNLTAGISAIAAVAVYVWEAINSIFKNRQYIKTRR
jgi:hypothetical protein